MNGNGQSSAGEVAPLEVGMLVYPNLTLLDLAGPQAALGFHSKTHLLWKTLDPVISDTGVAVVPTATLADELPPLDVLFVPGGFGTTAVMEDSEVLAFLAEQGRTARYVTSVCTGSLILAKAGLLDGYRAATHWACIPALRAMGIEVEQKRVVTDRNRISGGGVTAGIDFGLTLLATLRDEDTARMTQLMLEYDPAPPFNAGSPAGAGSSITDAVMAVLAPSHEEMMRVCGAATASQHDLTI